MTTKEIIFLIAFCYLALLCYLAFVNWHAAIFMLLLAICGNTGRIK